MAPTRCIWVVIGPVASGKSTVGEFLANSLKLTLIEGNSFYTPANLDKINSNDPLNEQDIWDWLVRIQQAIEAQIESGSCGVVVSCSALRQRYRDVLRAASFFRQAFVRFFFLDAPEHLLLERLRNRDGDHTSPEALGSELQILQRPNQDETDIFTIDASVSIADVQNAVLAAARADLESHCSNCAEACGSDLSW